MNKLMKQLFCALMLLAVPAYAEQLTIDRFVSSPSLNGSSIRGLKLAPNGQQVTYLKGKKDNHRQLDLWAYDIAQDRHYRLVDSVSLVPGGEKLSEVEKLRRERMRITGRGIVEYYWAPNSNALLFPLSGDLYYLPLNGKVRALTQTDAFETDIRFSPKGNYVSFVRDQNLYVIEIATGKEQRLTQGGGGVISNAMAEFLAQEEMGRNTGYWWSPDETYIAFTRIDETKVKLVKRYEMDGNGAVTVVPQRYPFAGSHNVEISLGVVPVQKNQKKVVWVDLGKETDIYLNRVHWLPDSSAVTFQRQNRQQTKQNLVFADAKTGKSKVVLTETSDVWITLHNDLYFLNSADQFIWASARNGFKHLYLVDYNGDVVTPLTVGDWVVDRLVGVNETTGTAYFTGNAEGVLERHLYSVPLSGDQSQMQRVTQEPGWHRLSYGCRKQGQQCGQSLFIDYYSSVDQPPKIDLRAADGSLITNIVENSLDETHPYHPYLDDHVKLEFGQLTAADGQTLHYQIMKPKNMQKGKKYPAVLSPYGGPHSQLVKNAWYAQWFNQYLAQNGYVVFILDNRGTHNRGIEFEGAIKGNLGEAEVADQITGVDYLRSLDFVDADNIGIYGWSYGAYLTLMNLFKEPEYFAAGVAIAPVTDWTLYDTFYSERYLFVPEKEGDFNQSSVLSHVDNYLQSEKNGKLLLVHGMADDNVFFDHSVKLISTLQNKRVDFEMMAYPGKRHGIRGANTRGHLWNMVFNFFERELKN